MKKLFGSLIALMCVIACLLPLPIEAEAATEGYYSYYVYNGEVTITDVDTAISGAITIPSTLGGCPVTKIGESAFEYCTNLTSVTIPDGVITIGGTAFGDCSNLISVIIPDSVTTIGNHAFYYCTSLADITLPDGITGIGMYTFSDCYSLTNITIPDGVTTIGQTAFRRCTGLTNITIPDSVTTLGYQAFYSCSGLTSVTIGKGVTSIGEWAFKDCSGLTSVTIPAGVTAIDSSAFGGCDSLTNVTYCGTQTQWNEIAIESGNTDLTDAERNYHIWQDATCTAPKTCTLCGETTGEALGHHYLSETVKEPNCYESGIVIYTCSRCNDNYYSYPGGNGHSYDDATCTTPQVCTVCGRVVGEALGHNYTSVTVLPTCTQRGYTTYTCTRCDYSYTANGGSATGHQYLGLDDDCTAPQVCEICGYEDYSVASEHSFTSFETPPTCIEQGYTTYTCGKCGVCYIDDYVSTTEHSYVTEILETPSFTAPGQQQKTCSVCGDTVTETLDMLVGKVSGWNVTLQDDLQVNFHLNISASIESTARVRIVVGEEGYTFRVSGLKKTEDGLYVASVNIAAAQMTDFIFVTVINGSNFAETASYTVRGYADTILADESFSEYHALVKEMLNYGAAAQIYFDYEEENLANEGIADAGSAEIPDSVDSELSVTGNAEGVTFYGASLIFRNKIAVRYYFQFKGDINDCSFAVNDTTYAPQLKDGLYYVEIADILPQDLDEEIALTVTDAEGNSLAVCYNPMNYIVRMNEKGSEALQNLVKALYNYHLAAKSLVITEDPPANEDVIPDDTGTEDVSPDDTWWTETEDDMVEEDELLPPEWE